MDLPADITFSSWENSFIYPDGCLESILKHLPPAEGLGELPYYPIDFIPLSKQFDVITLFHPSEFISEMAIKKLISGLLCEKSYSSFVSCLGDWHYIQSAA